MLGRIRSRLTYANVASSIALFIALGTGGAYAADTIGSADIIDESILVEDIKNGEVTTSELAARVGQQRQARKQRRRHETRSLDESLNCHWIWGLTSVGTSEIAGDAVDSSNGPRRLGRQAATSLDSSLTGDRHPQ